MDVLARTRESRPAVWMISASEVMITGYSHVLGISEPQSPIHLYAWPAGNTNCKKLRTKAA